MEEKIERTEKEKNWDDLKSTIEDLLRHLERLENHTIQQETKLSMCYFVLGCMSTVKEEVSDAKSQETL